jgi:acetylornithine deacetylase/succinyl-diaminopimelate desuccinylase-like protein
MATDLIGTLERLYDHAFVVDTLLALARTPVDVPLGRHEIDPTDPRVTHYVHSVVRPVVERLGLGPVTIDELNNLTCTMGAAVESPSVLAMAYVTSQHGNYTDPALEGQLRDGRDYGVDEDCVFGKGTSQNKGALAALLGAFKIIVDGVVPLRGRLVFVVNAESQSSHRCTAHLIEHGGVRADAGWLAMGSPRIVTGHRGRVDVHVKIRGESTHSSQPHLGRNAIWGLREVLNRLAVMKDGLSGRHPDLGPEQLEPYQLVTAPIAPHTIPDEARLILDRRLLPGTEPDDAVHQVRDALADIRGCDVTVHKGAHHLPYQVSENLPLVRALARAHQVVRGGPPEIGPVPFAFDAGYPTSRGIPTVMFGPANQGLRSGGRGVLATEFIPLSIVRDFALIYAHAILTMLGSDAQG